MIVYWIAKLLVIRADDSQHSSLQNLNYRTSVTMHFTGYKKGEKSWGNVLLLTAGSFEAFHQGST